MTLLYLVMISFGVVGIGLSWWGQGALKRPYDTVSAFCLSLSLIIALMGALLFCVPHFFD
ncbi:MAG: hypothetical protein HY282_14730 [Nitrospirae bacterium]|nr:hypothetical protein [Candidatus Manganitrophaceae bacterium]